jgi:hypothetical protein
MIKKCTCKHEYQDKKYGKGNRIFNPTSKKKGADSIYYRCTVCLREE